MRWMMLLFAFACGAALADTAQWEPEIAAYEAADRTAPPKPGGVVFVGSSSIRLWSTLAADFPGVDVINRGFGGSELRDATAFVPRIVAPYRPRQVVLYAGDNDLANGRAPADVAADFEAFIASVRSFVPDARIAVIAIKPSPARIALRPQGRGANERLAAVAKANGADFIDVATPMLDANGEPRAELFVEDRLHLSAQGYAVWRDVVAPYLADDRRLDD